MGAIDNKSKYTLFHPTLFQLAIELQVDFFRLPDLLRKRLLEINFEVLLYCDNPIDFYSFRQFILDNHRVEVLTTIVERVDAEIKLAERFLIKGIWGEYANLPERNFDFYRENKQRNLLLELKKKEKNESGETEEVDINLNNSFPDSINITNKTIKAEKSFFDAITEKIKQGAKVIEFSEGVLGNGVSIGKNIFLIIEFLKGKR